MRILYLHQYFKTPQEGGAIRSYYIAKALVEAGHEVEMITSTNTKKDEIVDIEGIKVHYLPVYYHNKLSYPQRLWAFIKFVWKAYKKASKIENVDKVYATSTPLSIGLVALWLKMRKGLPYIFEVRDLWPLVPIEIKIIKNILLKKVLFGLERRIYKGADKIIALSPPIKVYIESVVEKPIFCLPNMADVDFWKPTYKKLKQHKIIAYIGTLGTANAVSSFIGIAKVFQEKKNENFTFWIVGEGKEETHIRKLVATYQLRNIYFFKNVDKFQLRALVKQIDAMYVPFAPYQSLETGSPNKFFDSLASGKLTILNFKGWLREVVESNLCGIYVDNSEHAYQQLTNLSDEMWITYQQNAMKIANEYFAKDKICNELIKIIQS